MEWPKIPQIYISPFFCIVFVLYIFSLKPWLYIVCRNVFFILNTFKRNKLLFISIIRALSQCCWVERMCYTTLGIHFKVTSKRREEKKNIKLCRRWMVQFEHYIWKSCKTSNSEILHFAVLRAHFYLIGFVSCRLSSSTSVKKNDCLILVLAIFQSWALKFVFSFKFSSRWQNLLKNSHELNKRIYIFFGLDLDAIQ